MQKLLKTIFVLLLIVATALLFSGWQVVYAPPSESSPTPRPTMRPTPMPEPPGGSPTATAPAQERFTFSFVGDCTFASDHGSAGASYSFASVIGDDYKKPFQHVMEYFGDDDVTLINLECALTTYNVPAEKQFRFRGDPRYVNVLLEGSVECVTLCNNHSRDYGERGYTDTKELLDQNGVAYLSFEEPAIFTTKRGLKVGVVGGSFPKSIDHVKKQIKKCQEAQCEVIVAVYHWSDEYQYKRDSSQVKLAQASIDAGAHIVVGHHPHVLQAMEVYKGQPIFYSLGNFSFGGNSNPRDRDTVVMQQQVYRQADGTIRMGETIPIPCALSDVPGRNSYCPIPYQEGSAEYERTMKKLRGEFNGVHPGRPTPTPAVTPTPVSPVPTSEPTPTLGPTPSVLEPVTT